MRNSAKTSIAKLFRAPWNFEEDYAGKAGDIPILFTHPFNTTILPAGTPDTFTALDPEAALQAPPSGVSPVLARFCASPMGSTVAVFLPIVRMHMPITDTPPVTGWGYVWRILFRMRSVADYIRRKKARVPYSLGLGRMGTPDSRAGTVFDRPSLAIAGPRVVRPGISESAIYNRTQPQSTAAPPFFSAMHTDAVSIPVNPLYITNTPVYPGAGAGGIGTINSLDYEQGEIDPVTGFMEYPIQTSASHLCKFVKCVGNEMAVECYKYNLETSGQPYTPRAWDFTFDVDGNVDGGEDIDFSRQLGVAERTLGRTPPIDTGVRVITGTWPR